MTIYQRLGAIFERAGIPGFMGAWIATPDYPAIPQKYGVYTLVDEDDALCADDMEIAHRYEVDIDLYGTMDLSAEAQAIERALIEGAWCIERTRDIADWRRGEYLYHKRIEATYFDLMT